MIIWIVIVIQLNNYFFHRVYHSRGLELYTILILYVSHLLIIHMLTNLFIFIHSITHLKQLIYDSREHNHRNNITCNVTIYYLSNIRVYLFKPIYDILYGQFMVTMYNNGNVFTGNRSIRTCATSYFVLLCTFFFG